MGLDVKAEMDRDIYHFTRLGFDLYRVHVWDTEISDEQGNLIQNEHLENFDYLLSELKKRGFKIVLTPIAYWGNGWPEPDEETPGFSNKYGKDKSLTDPEAIKAQENYLTQFVDHVNPYTNLSYGNDPDIIAFEISNEPHHRESPEKVTEFVSKMVAAIQKTGSKKPIFYNVSHSIHLAEAYFDAGIDGGTFQWYPTGLGFGQELEGNLLPNVNKYKIPFDEVIKKNSGAKLVYEFDAADVHKAYMYPAMARSFREAGIQVATHFSYDPTFLAYANTEYNTHFMNLNYAPHKALGLMISSKIFHELPLNEDVGTYPENLKFGNVSLNYEDDLAIYNAEETFIYTNSTNQGPRSLQELKHLAGHGSSAVVDYAGKGAYFLDKLKNGVWRLEVMPDPFVVANLFGKNSTERTLAVIKWNENSMQLNLPDLGGSFHISPVVSERSSEEIHAENGEFQVSPGIYLLTKSEKNIEIEAFQSSFRFDLKTFYAQEDTVERTYLMHDAVWEISEGHPLKLKIQAVSNHKIEKIEAWFQNGNSYANAEAVSLNTYDFEVEVPDKVLEAGILNYRLIVTTSEGKRTFPGNVSGSPADWDFKSDTNFTTRMVEDNDPIQLFHAEKDHEKLVMEWSPQNRLVPTASGGYEFRIKPEQLFKKDPENLNAKAIYDYSLRYNVIEKISGRREAVSSKEKLVILGHGLSGKAEKIQIALVDDQGTSYGKTIDLPAEKTAVEIPISDLQRVRTVSLPRPYPGFQPYYFEPEVSGFRLENIEAVQISIGPGLPKEDLEKDHGFALERIWLK